MQVVLKRLIISLHTNTASLSSLLSAKSFKLCRRMSDSVTGKEDHLQRTKHDFRQINVTPATVCSITEESETVKALTLKVDENHFTFKAGQWIDFFIPGIEIFTGYSMCSSPQRLREKGELQLAVKFSDYPPTEWVHTKCQVGSQVTIRVGGNFYYDPQPDEVSSDLLLIAGGVGINPLYAMLCQVADLHQAVSAGQNVYKPGKTILLFSARSESELLFKDNILQLCENMPNMECQFFVTRAKENRSLIESHVTAGRINDSVLKSTLAEMKRESLRCCICGPPPMIADIEQLLPSMGVSNKQISYEKWW
ncbi:oxidoreductase NAD-binding domain-containing protein 1-like [Glandiceps talaboti]